MTTTIPGRLENVIRMYNKGSLEIRQMLLQWWCRPIFPTILDSILDSIFPPPHGSIFPIFHASFPKYSRFQFQNPDVPDFN